MSMFWSTAPSTGALAQKLEEEPSHERMWKTFESNIILKMGHSQPAWESRGMLLSLEQLDITVSFASSHFR